MGGIVGDMCVKLHQWCFEVWSAPDETVVDIAEVFVEGRYLA